MKELKLSSLFITLTLITAMGFTSVANATDIILPVVSRPANLDEGVQRDLNSSQIEELLPWARNSKKALTSLLESTATLLVNEKNDQLILGIKEILKDRPSQNSEILFRYVLSRALVLNEILSEEMDADATGSADVKFRVLNTSILMAIDFYDVDSLQKSSRINFINFGRQYYNFLIELNKSIFDASAQYRIQLTALQWMQWDLYRDLNNKNEAATIVKINNALKDFTANKVSDKEAIAYLQKLKKASRQAELENSHYLFKVIESKRRESITISYNSPGDKIYAQSGIGPVEATFVGYRQNGLAFVKEQSGLDWYYPFELLFQNHGCGTQHCVGEKVLYYDWQGWNYATVVAAGYYGSIIVQSDKEKKLIKPNLESDMSQTWGCQKNICVGDSMIGDLEGREQFNVEVVGIKSKEEFIVKITSGASAGLITKWNASSLYVK